MDPFVSGSSQQLLPLPRTNTPRQHRSISPIQSLPVLRTGHAESIAVRVSPSPGYGHSPRVQSVGASPRGRVMTFASTGQPSAATTLLVPNVQSCVSLPMQRSAYFNSCPDLRPGQSLSWGGVTHQQQPRQLSPKTFVVPPNGRGQSPSTTPPVLYSPTSGLHGSSSCTLGIPASSRSASHDAFQFNGSRSPSMDQLVNASARPQSFVAPARSFNIADIMSRLSRLEVEVANAAKQRQELAKTLVDHSKNLADTVSDACKDIEIALERCDNVSAGLVGQAARVDALEVLLGLSGQSPDFQRTFAAELPNLVEQCAIALNVTENTRARLAVLEAELAVDDPKHEAWAIDGFVASCPDGQTTFQEEDETATSRSEQRNHSLRSKAMLAAQMVELFSKVDLLTTQCDRAISAIANQHLSVQSLQAEVARLSALSTKEGHDLQALGASVSFAPSASQIQQQQRQQQQDQLQQHQEREHMESVGDCRSGERYDLQVRGVAA